MSERGITKLSTQQRDDRCEKYPLADYEQQTAIASSATRLFYSSTEEISGDGANEGITGSVGERMRRHNVDILLYRYRAA